MSDQDKLTPIDVSGEDLCDEIDTLADEIQRLREDNEAAMKSLEEWCDHECDKLGAVDGYDYRSGQEYGLRCAAIEIKKRRQALSPQKEPAA